LYELFYKIYTKQPKVVKSVWPLKIQGEKYEIKGGGQEMAVIWQNFK